MSSSAARVGALRRRRKAAALEAMAVAVCPDCGCQLTVENVADYQTQPRCRTCSHRRRGQAAQYRRKVVVLPVTSAARRGVTAARQAVTSAQHTNRDREMNEELTSRPEIKTSERQLSYVTTTGRAEETKIVQLAVRPPSWSGPELHQRTLKVAAWWAKRTGRDMRAKEAAAAASLSLPMPALLSALEHVYRHAKANGFEARTLKPLWSDLKEAESNHWKRGAKPSGRGGMRSLSDLLARRVPS